VAVAVAVVGCRMVSLYRLEGYCCLSETLALAQFRALVGMQHNF
jgi:hypothetical protein